MKRVLVIGSGGAGKSTFSRRLGERLGLEVIHLDVEHWRPGWVEPPKDEWARKVDELCGRESWVMDGNFSGTLEQRLAACDTVVFLDLPRAVCAWRALKRWVMYRDATRPDMAEGCREQFDVKFLLWVWNYPTSTRPKVLALLEKYADGKKVARVRSSAEAEEFLNSLEVRGAV
ncbi:MAG: DNA topology modulation protein [Acidobacteria bacterium]|nr:DNA topology modulation protein [Acidobacteriota bacterium]